MSTIAAKNIVGLSGEPLPDNLKPVTCTAWARFNGITGVVEESFNVSSITLISIGRYAVNYTDAMDTLSYSAVASGALTASDVSSTSRNIKPSNYALGSVGLVAVSTNASVSALDDLLYVTVHIFGGRT